MPTPASNLTRPHGLQIHKVENVGKALKFIKEKKVDVTSIAAEGTPWTGGWGLSTVPWGDILVPRLVVTLFLSPC